MIEALQRNPAVYEILCQQDRFDLPNAYVAAGAIAQTVWNEISGFAPDQGILDVDIVYYDADDLSESGEQANEARLRKLFAHLNMKLDIKNEARVHLWYESKFGYSIIPYKDVYAAIDTFPTTATAVGVRLAKGRHEVYAPFGLSDLLSGIVRPNKRQIARDIYNAKVARWSQIWPDLSYLSWD